MMKFRLSRLKPNTRRKQLFYLAGLVVVAAALVVALTHKTAKPVVKKSTGEPVITYSTDKPDESQKNADNYNWRGAPDEPKKIRIAKFGVDAFIQKAGVDQNNQVAVPNNIHLASWFSESQKPGQLGLSVIDGHVSGWTTDGVFKNLTKMVKGDTFEIELGNGKILNYKVFSETNVPTAEAANVLFSQDPTVSSQLNLITCTGKYVANDKAFNQRAIVSASLQ